ncbi:Uncharacterised protein [uncultured archaeon]|nr:Uncharacterised protein [uncultured archaeon]
MNVHHRDCPKVQAWDCGPEEGVWCRCPDGWPKSQEAWEEWYQAGGWREFQTPRTSNSDPYTRED